VVGLGAVVVALVLAGCETPGKLRSKNRQYEAMLQEAKAEKYELESKVASLQGENAELRGQMTKMAERESELESTRQRLEEQLKGMQVDVTIREGRLIMTLLSKVFFDTGKAVIKPDAKKTLDKISEVIKAEFGGNTIGIEGHTDNVPIKRPETKKKFKTNWELSTARALAVLHYLVDERKLPPQQFYAVGNSEYRPVASNKSADGRSQNRRVEIAIVPSPEEIR